MNTSSTNPSTVDYAAEDAAQRLRLGLYRFAAEMMRAPMDGRTAEEVLAITNSGVVAKMAEVYDFSGSGWATEGYSPVSFLTTHVMRGLGESDIDLAVRARRLADAL